LDNRLVELELRRHRKGLGMTEPDYPALLRFRTTLRRFQQWSELQAAAAGLTPAQHQLLLAVRGHEASEGPTIGEIADYLLVRHHSAVELVGRTERAGYVLRQRDLHDGRVVRVRLTPRGEETIRTLTAAHERELRTLEEMLRTLIDADADQ
jgi:DNA-binding MarR family transcriptional regulator